VEDLIISMTQDLLDRGEMVNRKYTYNNSSFKKNIEIMDKNKDPVKKAGNLKSTDRTTRLCSKFQQIAAPELDMPLVPPNKSEPGNVTTNLTPDQIALHGPRGIMIHSPGASQSSAQSLVNKFNSENPCTKSTHAFAGAGHIVQCLPWNFLAYHCAGYFNGTHLGLDIMEPDTIQNTKVNNRTVYWIDSNKEQETLTFIQNAYATAVELAAYLCRLYELDPLGMTDSEVPLGDSTVMVPVILSHKEGHFFGKKNCPGLLKKPPCKCSSTGNNCWASNHSDPHHMWENIKVGSPTAQATLKTGLTMDTFRQDVATRKQFAYFCHVVDDWNKDISIGRLPHNIHYPYYPTGKKAGSGIDWNRDPILSRYTLSKIDLATLSITTPQIGSEGWYPKTYPTYKPGYRVAVNNLQFAFKAAAVATKAAHDAGETKKIYTVHSIFNPIMKISLPVSLGINIDYLKLRGINTDKPLENYLNLASL